MNPLGRSVKLRKLHKFALDSVQSVTYVTCVTSWVLRAPTMPVD